MTPGLIPHLLSLSKRRPEGRFQAVEKTDPRRAAACIFLPACPIMYNKIGKCDDGDKYAVLSLQGGDARDCERSQEIRLPKFTPEQIS